MKAYSNKYAMSYNTIFMHRGIKLTVNVSSIKTQKQPITMIGCFITLTGRITRWAVIEFFNVGTMKGII